MSDITNCQVVNSVDEKSMTLSTKWSNDEVQILILKNGVEPLRAQVPVRKLLEHAGLFKLTKENFLKEIKDELGGNNNEIQFSLSDRFFHWKKKAWKRGQIECEYIHDVKVFSEIVQDILKDDSTSRDITKKLKVENENLRNRCAELQRVNEEIVTMKNAYKEEFFQKFFLLVNTKKRKIRELIEELEEKTRKNSNDVFDRSTDVSGDENEGIQVVEEPQLKRSKKPKLETEKKLFGQSSVFANITRAIVNDSASTSLSEKSVAYESDESIELRYEESQELPVENVSKLDFAEEESGDDLFSQ